MSFGFQSLHGSRWLTKRSGVTVMIVLSCNIVFNLGSWSRLYSNDVFAFLLWDLFLSQNILDIIIVLCFGAGIGMRILRLFHHSFGVFLVGDDGVLVVHDTFLSSKIRCPIDTLFEKSMQVTKLGHLFYCLSMHHELWGYNNRNYIGFKSSIFVLLYFLFVSRFNVCSNSEIEVFTIYCLYVRLEFIFSYS